MNLVNTVFDTAEKFMKHPKYVNINHKHITRKIKDLKKETPPNFPNENGTDDVYKSCLLELVADSINYCYWYGSADIRPLDASTGKTRDILIYAFSHYSRSGGRYSCDSCLNLVVKYLSLERYPLIEERIKHLDELRNYGQEFIDRIISHDKPLDEYLQLLVQSFPGYASDIFLKRAILFFGQLNRMFGWFEDDMKDFPIPADYQVPKMLKAASFITYNNELEKMITDETQIPKTSLIECEIRAASILACRELAQKLNWTMPQIDGYFWLRRKDVTTPFHLTVTTDY